MATAAYAGANSGRGERVALRRVPLAAAVALAAGVAANVALYLIGRATGAIEALALPNGQTFGLAPVLTVTVAATLAGAAAYALLGAIGRLRRPVTLYRILALGVLLLSLPAPFGIPDAGAGMVLFLELMHLTTAAAIVGALTTLAARRE